HPTECAIFSGIPASFRWELWCWAVLQAEEIYTALVSAGLTGKLVGWLGERKAIILALSVGAVTFRCYGLASKGWMMYAAIALGSIGGIAVPAIQSLITKMTPATEQGAVQGVISRIQSLAAIVGPLMATNLFAYFTSSNAPAPPPGAAFVASSILVAVGVLLAIRSARAAPAMEAIGVQETVQIAEK